MTKEMIDLDTLNELFENQGKIDDVFNMTFDDDSFLGSSISFDDDLPDNSSQMDSSDFNSNSKIKIDSEDMELLHKKKTNIIYYIVPMAIEIAAIYYGIVYFT